MRLEINIDLTAAALCGADILSDEAGTALGKIAKAINDSLIPMVDFDKYQNVKDTNDNIIGVWRLK
jgi:hypothetical protein